MTNEKHLEFVQAVITRQAGNAFLIKGWALTVVSGLLGLAISTKGWGPAGVAFAPIAGFAFMDAYYLRQERLYRCLWNAIISTDGQVADFSMDARSYRQSDGCSWSAVLFSATVFGFYVVLMAVTIVVLVANIH